MRASRITPSIAVTIGRGRRIYHAFVTTAPTGDARSCGSGWINVRQAAFHTSCCAATIRKACRAGELQHIRIGHSGGPIRTRPEWVDAWIMRGMQEPVGH